MNPFGFIEGPLEDFLRFLNEDAGFTFGWAIVVLTVCVRIVLLPLFVSQYRSARRMQEIAPQLKALQTKFKSDKRKQQEEMMRLFQEHKVNPFGSCLPIVFQFPIFIALFYVLRKLSRAQSGGSELSFMWIFPDVSQEFRTIGWTAAIVALIYGASQLLATEVSMATTPQTNEWQRKLFRVLPLFIVGGLFLYPNIPAGLVLYWMTTNLWTGGQQVVLKRRLGPLQVLQAPPDVGGDEDEAKAKPKAKAPPGGGTKPTKGAGTSGKKPPPKPAPAEASAGDGEATTATPRKPRAQQPRGGSQSQRRRPPKKR